MRIYFRFSFLLLFGALFYGCSYQIKKNEVRLDALFQNQGQTSARLFVPIPDNLTLRTGPELFLAKALRENLSQVNGIQVVDSESQADFILLGTVVANDLRSRKDAVYLGDASTAAAGGLSVGQTSASSFELEIGFRVKMLKIISKEKLAPRNLLWNQEYLKAISFGASSRFEKNSDSASGGSSSATHINESREKLYTEILADQIAKDVLDQVTQSF